MGINATHNNNLKEIVEEFYTSSLSWDVIYATHYASVNVAVNCYNRTIEQSNLSNYIQARQLFHLPFLIRKGHETEANDGIKKYLRDKFFKRNETVDPVDKPVYITTEELAEHNQRVLSGEEYQAGFTCMPTETVGDKKVVDYCPQQMYPDLSKPEVTDTAEPELTSMYFTTNLPAYALDNIVKCEQNKLDRNGYLFLSDLIGKCDLYLTKEAVIGGWLKGDTVSVKALNVLNSTNLIFEIKYRPNILDEFEKFAV